MSHMASHNALGYTGKSRKKKMKWVCIVLTRALGLLQKKFRGILHFLEQAKKNKSSFFLSLERE